MYVCARVSVNMMYSCVCDRERESGGGGGGGSYESMNYVNIR